MVILQAETSHQTDTVLEQIEEIYKRTGEAGSFRPSVVGGEGSVGSHCYYEVNLSL